MTRTLVLALILSIAYVPAAVAGETLLESAKRATRELATAEASSPRAALESPDARAARPAGVQTARANLQEGQPGLATSGLGTRSKIFIAVAAAAAFAGIAYAIDQGVEDNTPSSLGLR